MRVFRDPPVDLTAACLLTRNGVAIPATHKAPWAGSPHV